MGYARVCERKRYQAIDQASGHDETETAMDGRKEMACPSRGCWNTHIYLQNIALHTLRIFLGRRGLDPRIQVGLKTTPHTCTLTETQTQAQRERDSNVPSAYALQDAKGSTRVSRLGSKKKGMERRSFPNAGRTRCGVERNLPLLLLCFVWCGVWFAGLWFGGGATLLPSDQPIPIQPEIQICGKSLATLDACNRTDKTHTDQRASMSPMLMAKAPGMGSTNIHWPSRVWACFCSCMCSCVCVCVFCLLWMGVLERVGNAHYRSVL